MGKVYDLWYIVESVKADIGITTQKHDLRFFKWAIDGYRELNCYNILPTMKTVTIDVDASGVAILPQDCDYWNIIKIGICINGSIINFWANDKICLKRETGCCDVQQISKTINNIMNGTCLYDYYWYYLPYYHNGQFVAGLYGVGEGFYGGGFRYDEERGVLQFEPSLSARQIIIEYKSNGELDIHGNAYIPEIAIRPLRNYVHRERCQFEIAPDRRMTTLYRNDAIIFGRRYANGLKAAIAKIRSIQPDELYAIWKASLTQLPKR